MNKPVEDQLHAEEGGENETRVSVQMTNGMEELIFWNFCMWDWIDANAYMTRYLL